MKYFKRIILLALVVLILLIGQYCYYTWPCPYAAYFGTDYPEKFSHYKFSKIRIGMSEDEVVELLGETRWRVSSEEFGFDDNNSFDYFLIYFRVINSENYSPKQVFIKNKQVVDITNACNCEDGFSF